MKCGLGRQRRFQGENSAGQQAINVGLIRKFHQLSGASPAKDQIILTEPSVRDSAPRTLARPFIVLFTRADFGKCRFNKRNLPGLPR
jgi:hypothetical protein